eukprot:1160624-Pelagomonas_calceolata.AAC.17
MAARSNERRACQAAKVTQLWSSWPHDDLSYVEQCLNITRSGRSHSYSFTGINIKRPINSTYLQHTLVAADSFHYMLLEASKQQHRDLCRDLSRASAQVTLHTILLGVGGKKTTHLALKLPAHSVQYAYKLSSTRRALEKTPLNSRHQDQARATASNPLVLLVPNGLFLFLPISVEGSTVPRLLLSFFP